MAENDDAAKAEAEAAKAKAEKAKADEKPVFTDEKPVETSHELQVGNRTLRYKATAGRLPIKNAKGEIDAQVFCVYYALESATPVEERPLTFAFNGGPGSASVWLHLGALGPRRVLLNDDGSLPAPPYKLVPNDQTWLGETDLVFIDPVGTGYSRAKDDETAKKYFGVEGDIECLAEFIRLFLTRNNRWASPLYLAGESYGTTRGAGLAGYLVERGIAFTGLILISTVLGFQAIRFRAGNDLPFALFLPTYAATAHYHGRLAPELQERALPDLLKEVREFALGDYTLALMQGNRMHHDSRAAMAARIARYTGLSEKYVEQCELRIEHWRFCKELLRDEGRIVGRLDSRLTAREGDNAAEGPDFDASNAAIRPPFTASINDYLRRSLGYETDQPYEVSGSTVKDWKWENGSFTDTGAALASALAKNPHLRVLVTCGYFDLATPFASAEYTAAHLPIDPGLRQNIEFTYYPAGHMMYIEAESLKRFTADVRVFYGGVDPTGG